MRAQPEWKDWVGFWNARAAKAQVGLFRLRVSSEYSLRSSHKHYGLA
jgi:hypothetical protein